MTSAMHRICLALVFIGSAFSIGAEAIFDSKTPSQWLWKMNEAFSQQNYDGVFSYYNGTDLSTMRVVHAIIDGVQRERLVHLNGALREIVRVGDEVSCILQPGDELLTLENSLPAGPFARAFTRNFDQLSDHYQLSFHGLDRVAGRDAIRLAINAPDNNRYAHRLWLDTATGFLLRSEMVDESGKRLEIFQFSSIQIDLSIAEELLVASAPDGSIVTHLRLESDELSEKTSVSGSTNWYAAWMPGGFKMSAWDLRHTPNAGKKVRTLMYSDGLAAFSVFIEDMPSRGAGNVVSRSGATIVVTVGVQGPDKTQLVTVVGELPTGAAQRIARSVTFKVAQ
ncbi:MAG: MucB/RseB C-terminal domain-containing protein [Pseudomonadales bacterium]|nr:MucB/RseB C-terminal domain-containing protein [Pseudomonadales bacterium]